MILPSDREPGAGRKGLISVAVLVALILIGLICAGLLKVAFARRGEIGREERSSQAAWLAEAGVGRALARLQASGDYSGEEWDISAEDIGGRGPGRVTIRVEGAEPTTNRRKIHVQADYPAGSSLRARQTREVQVAIKPTTR